MKLPASFANIKIAVIGDVMLDRYWWGNVTRISPEAPVPVVKLARTSVAAGGAGNVAANVVGLGASAILIGITGRDTEAEILTGLVSENAQIDCRLIKLSDRETTVKTRIVAHNQHVVRLDQETTTPVSAAESELAIDTITAAIEASSAVIVSDYAKGFLTDDLLKTIFSIAKASGKMVFADPKSVNFSKYKGATCITPNLKEASEAVKTPLNTRASINRAGTLIRANHAFEAVLITEGEHGMTLFDNIEIPFHRDALALDVFDVTGAGDTVIAAFSVAAAAGIGFREAASIANVAAGIAVGHIGTTVVTRTEIDDFINTAREKTSGV